MPSFHLSTEWLLNLLAGVMGLALGQWGLKYLVLMRQGLELVGMYAQSLNRWFLHGTSVCFHDMIKGIYSQQIEWQMTQEWSRYLLVICFKVILQIPHESIAITVAPTSANSQHKCTWRAKSVYDDVQTIDTQRNMKSAELDKQNMWMFSMSQGHLEFILP
jgi:hypothetical protein